MGRDEQPRPLGSASDYLLRVQREHEKFLRQITKMDKVTLISPEITSTVDDLINGPFRELQKAMRTAMLPSAINPLVEQIRKNQEAQTALLSKMIPKVDLGLDNWTRSLVTPGLVGAMGKLVDEVGEVSLPEEENEPEIISNLTESAAQFVTRHGRGLSPEAQERLFVTFIRTVVFIILMSAAFASEASKEVVEIGAPALEIVLSSQLGDPARSAWRRWRSSDHEEDQD